MRVIVIRNCAHVVVNTHLKVEMGVYNYFQLLMKALLHLLRRMWVVHTPHHHGYCATFTFGNPTFFVFVEPFGHASCLAEFTRVATKDAHVTTVGN